jgi:gliding motility-associated-like protein
MGLTQSVSQNLSTEGNDFWVGFMNNWDTDPQGNPILLEIYVSAKDSTRGVLDIPRNDAFTPISFKVFPGQATLISIPTSMAMPNDFSGIEDKGIHITAESQVSVFAMNKRRYSADETVVLPTYSLSNEYLVMSHWEDGNRNNNDNSNSELVIVAVADNTNVRITPSVATSDGHNAGETFTVNLQQGQLYNLLARGDLTGTEVVVVNNNAGQCNNVAVFAGNQYTQVGECEENNGHDHLYAQQYPLKTWGTEFITVNYEPRDGGDIVKVLAQEDNTLVNIAGENVALNKGLSVKRLLDGVNTIRSNKPIAVGQFSRTEGCDGSLGDPFFILLSPNEQLLTEITFNAPGIATTSTFSLNVIAPIAGISGLRLDGTGVGGDFSVVPGNPNYAFSRFSISGGNHTIESSNGFIAYVYGYGNNESFGYSAGASLANLTLSVQIRNSNGIEVPIDELCHRDELEFTPITEFNYDAFEWNFGDGSFLITTNDGPVYHTYDEAGTYLLQLTGIAQETDCTGGDEQTEVRLLTVINPQVPVLGPRSVCPFTEDVLYVTENPLGLSNSWYVTGGQIVEAYRDSIRVDWGETNDQGAVKLLSHDANICYGDTTIFPVKINLKLEPEAPLGTDSICANNRTDWTYSAYFFNGSVYDWQADGGTIREGQGSRQVVVDWGDLPIGKLWYDQSVPGEDICEGTSDTLFVFFQRTPDPSLEIVGEKSTYQIGEWASFSAIADTLYQYVRWELEGEVLYDSANLEEQVLIPFGCPGVYQLSALAYDTVGVCPNTAENILEVSVTPPEVEIINVTNDTSRHGELMVNWHVTNHEFGDYAYSLIRQTPTNQWNSILTEEEWQVYVQDAQADVQYAFEVLIREEGCEEGFGSLAHKNSVLQASEYDQEERLTLNWSGYEGWTEGVDHYEVYLSIDGRPTTLIASTTELSYDFRNEGLGFDHCFLIKAVELGGNESYSWSNQLCHFFEPELKVYNVFTPNGDDYNPTFVINNIEAYTQSVLTITDRSGNRIFERKNYKNDWDGGNHPAGVYYYMVELNEPRIDTKIINGYFTLLK